MQSAQRFTQQWILTTRAADLHDAFPWMSLLKEQLFGHEEMPCLSVRGEKRLFRTVWKLWQSLEKDALLLDPLTLWKRRALLLLFLVENAPETKPMDASLQIKMCSLPSNVDSIDNQSKMIASIVQRVIVYRGSDVSHLLIHPWRQQLSDPKSNELSLSLTLQQMITLCDSSSMDWAVSVIRPLLTHPSFQVRQWALHVWRQCYTFTEMSIELQAVQCLRALMDAVPTCARVGVSLFKDVWVKSSNPHRRILFETCVTALIALTSDINHSFLLQQILNVWIMLVQWDSNCFARVEPSIVKLLAAQELKPSILLECVKLLAASSISTECESHLTRHFESLQHSANGQYLIRRCQSILPTSKWTELIRSPSNVVNSNVKQWTITMKLVIAHQKS